MILVISFKKICLFLDRMSISYRWCHVFLKSDARIPEEDRDHIVSTAVAMHFHKEREKRVEGEHYEGTIKTDGTYQCLGAFSGEIFNASLDVDGHGRIDISFLVTEKVREDLN